MLTTEWFTDAVRPDVVMAELTKACRDLADGRLTLLGCRVTRIRAVPGDESWMATYDLDLLDVDTGLERTVTAKGVLTPPGVPLLRLTQDKPFGAAGWTCTLPDLRLHLRGVTVDDALPGLAVITDAEHARLLLQESLSAGGAPFRSSAISGCDPTVITHKFGVRATVVCRLVYLGDLPNAPAAVVVKVHHDDEGRLAHEAMRALAATSLGSSAKVGLARPLAYLPDLRLSIQEHVDHQGSLKDLFHNAFGSGGSTAWRELLDAMRATAAGLAELHQCGTDFGASVTWHDELATLRRKHDRLAMVMPTLRDRTDRALERLEAAAARTAADPLGPAHHSFRPAQVLLHEGRVSFIDFDKFCRAEPASDIALLTAKILHMGVNKVDTPDSQHDRQARLAELREVFLDEYLRHARVSAGRVAVWEALELLSLVLSAAKKVNGPWIDSCARMLEHHLDTRDM